MLKRILCLLLTVCLMLPLTVSAASPSISALQRSANKKEIYTYLTGTLGCNRAAACGILANIERESSYNPQAQIVDTNGKISYGLCQWNGSRHIALQDFCAKNGLDYTTVTGQLQYLRSELKSSEARAWSYMQGFSNSLEGARGAGLTWASKFERCTKSDWERRGKLAADLYVEMGGNAVTGVLLGDTAKYQSGQFPDVSSQQWFAPSVETAVEKGLMKGDDLGQFNPFNSITVAESITMACRIYSRFTGDGASFQTSGMWYTPYFDYALRKGIIDRNLSSADPNKAATRTQFAQIMAKALPEGTLGRINTVPDNAIPDVKTSDRSGSAVYALYRQGILTGDEAHSFHGERNIQRAEAAAIAARIAVPALRQSFVM